MSIQRGVGAVLVLHCFGITEASAQIVTDGTMGAAITLLGPNMEINEALGTRLGSNLFHSFADFNVQLNESATFTSNFAGLTSNVISRVTGGNVSVINGLLSSEIAGADFWFINPNGLVFGTNAVLDVPAGFHASTADVVELADGGTFRATNPGASSLTVASPSAFGFLDATVGTIDVTGSNLAVANGEALSLVGGAMELDGASLEAHSGRIDLVSVASTGEVETGAAAGTAPDVSGFTAFGDIELNGLSSVDAGSNGAASGGTVAVVASGVDVFGGSNISASSSGTGDAGDIVMLAASQLQVADGGSLTARSTSVAADAGDAGRLIVSAPSVVMHSNGQMVVSTVNGVGGLILIKTHALNLRDDPSTQLDADTHGSGRGGDIVIRGLASTDTDITRANTVLVQLDTSIHSDSTASGVDAGQAGTITMHANQVRLAQGGTMSVSTVDGSGTDGFGEPLGGAIDIHTNFLVTEEAGFLFADTTGAGQGGQISVQAYDVTGPFTIIADEDGAIKTSTSGTGDAGSIVLGSADAPIDFLRLGQPNLPFDDTRGLFSESTAVGPGAGGAGTITVFADQVDIQGAQLSVATVDGSRLDGSGNPVGGSINLNVGTLQLGTFGVISAATTGAGAGGSIAVLASDPNLADDRPAIEIIDGQITSSASGSGNAGDITVGSAAAPVDFLWMHDFEFDAPDHVPNDLDHGLFSDSTATGVDAGTGGEITVYARDIQIRDDGKISASTVAGSGGAIALAIDNLTVSGGFVQALTSGSGDAGSISITGIDGGAADRIQLDFLPSTITTSSFSTAANAGDSGAIDIAAQEISLTQGADIASSTSGGGSGGSIRIEVDDLSLVGTQSDISVGTLGSGDAGNIVIDGIDGAPVTRIFAAGESAGIRSDSSRIFGSPSLLGASGSISIRTRSLELDDMAAVTVRTAGSSGGVIDLGVDTLSIVDGAVIDARTQETGDAGDISIHGVDGGRATSVLVAGEFDNPISSGIGARLTSGSQGVGPAAGDAGNINISATTVTVTDGGFLSADTRDALGGTIAMDVGQLTISDGSLVTTRVFGAGTGGSIVIDTDDLVLLDAGQMLADSSGTGPSGSISIVANELQLLNGAAISVRSTGAGRAGSVFTDLGTLFMTGNSQIDATATSSLAGNVELNVSEIAFLQDSLISGLSADPENDGGNFIIQQPQALVLQRSSILANSASGSGGNINISADAIVIDTESTVEATGEVLAVGEVLGSVLQLDPPIVVDAAAALDTSCTSQQAADRSSMIVRSTPPGAVREPYLPADAAVAAPSCRP